jgi:hypothetical protein
MLMLALDTATVTGFAIGKPGSIPRSGSVRLKKPSEPRDVAPFNAYCFLRDMWTLEKPDLVVVEHFMNPAAQKSADAIILQIEVYGVVVALCRAYGIRYEAPQRMTVVKHFLGQQPRQEREALKAKIVSRAILLGYMPRDCRDQNRADACALWDYGSAHHCRTPPRELVMFGEQPSEVSA